MAASIGIPPAIVLCRRELVSSRLGSTSRAQWIARHVRSPPRPGLPTLPLHAAWYVVPNLGESARTWLRGLPDSCIGLHATPNSASGLPQPAVFPLDSCGCLAALIHALPGEEEDTRHELKAAAARTVTRVPLVQGSQ